MQRVGPLNVTTDGVLVPVVVMNRYGHCVSDLQKSDFELYEDHVPQEIRYFTKEDIPISAVLLFDTSGSMARKLDSARMAAGEFLRASNPEDEFSLIEFSDDVRLVAPFTGDHHEIARKLPTMAGGWTALLDAIDLAVEELRYARNPRKALFIISDGGDNRSRHTVTEVKRRVVEGDVQVYSIGIFDPFEGDEESGESLLSDMAASTGGRLVKVDDVKNLPEAARTIGLALRNQYVLGYSPSPIRRDGRYHRIQVKLMHPKGMPKFVTSFRSGYRAPSH
jgi:Ca-activated chloride channel family protein